MLVLTRKQQQRIQIGDNVTITILRVKGQTVRVGIEAPEEIRVLRGELPATKDVVGEESESVATATESSEVDSEETTPGLGLKPEWSAPLAPFLQRGGAASASANASVVRL